MATLAPPESLQGKDNPNDQGGAILLTWQAPPETAQFSGYRIYRSESPNAAFVRVADEPASSTGYTDSDPTLRDGRPYYYFVATYADGESAPGAVVGPVVSRAQWFNTNRLNVLALALVICLVFGAYMALAAGRTMLRWQSVLFLFPLFPLVVWAVSRLHRPGAKMFVRRIAGLDAIDDALGRATEMGKPILFSFGLGYITDIVVVAALPLLRRIARKSADYAVRLLVPNSDPIVMTAAQETVKEACTESGRPDLYSADDINFLTSDQFGYAAGVDGMILREKPGAIFWLGYFYAESLIMAETGHSVGAIQLAGTTETTQLPFFVAACDYTMIGEEIYAASVYLKPEPMMLGSLKGEDLIRFWMIILITAIVALGTVATILGDRSPGFIRLFETVSGWLTPAG